MKGYAGKLLFADPTGGTPGGRGVPPYIEDPMKEMSPRILLIRGPIRRFL